MDSLTGPSTLQVSIDGQPLSLPDWLADSFQSIKTYLECVAMKRQRVLWSLQVDGVRLDLAECELPFDNYRTIRAHTISYDELAERLLSAGRTKVQELTVEIQEFSLTILINDDSLAQRLWYDWEPQLREPLFSLRAFNELKQDREIPGFDSSLLSKHLDQLRFLACEVESLFRHDSAETVDLIGFSELIDCTLLPWLKSLDQLFAVIQQSLRSDSIR